MCQGSWWDRAHQCHSRRGHDIEEEDYGRPGGTDGGGSCGGGGCWNSLSFHTCRYGVVERCGVGVRVMSFCREPFNVWEGYGGMRALEHSGLLSWLTGTHWKASGELFQETDHRLNQGHWGAVNNYLQRNGQVGTLMRIGEVPHSSHREPLPLEAWWEKQKGGCCKQRDLRLQLSLWERDLVAKRHHLLCSPTTQSTEKQHPRSRPHSIILPLVEPNQPTSGGFAAGAHSKASFPEHRAGSQIGMGGVTLKGKEEHVLSGGMKYGDGIFSSLMFLQRNIESRK